MARHRRFRARDLFDTMVHLWPCAEYEEFILEFDDGDTMTTTTINTQISRKLWLPHEVYDKLGIFKRHHIGNGSLSNERIHEVQGAITEDMYNTYGELGFNREELWRHNYYGTNRLYNESIVEYAAYVRGSNSFDFSHLYEYPPIAKIRTECQPNKLSIEKAYDAAKLVLERDPAIARNVIISDLRAGLLKMEQLLQILIVRGYNTDIDGHVYSKPIMGNYFAGIHDPAEAMMESTLAAKAIIFTGAPLEQTEYANRKMQFTTQQVDLLVMADCGSTEYGEIEITKFRFKAMDGLNYLDPDTNRLKPLRMTDTHLIGETRKFRLAFNCKYRHHNNVCKMCYGLLAYNVPFGANIGHIASTMTQSEVSQAVLKVKHSEASASSDPIIIQDEERPYILPASEGHQIRLNPRLGVKGIPLMLRGGYSQGVHNASKLPVLKRTDLRAGVNIAKFSQFREVSFELPSENKQSNRVHVTVSRGARMSNLTREFLDYFLKKGFRIDDDGYYRIDLKDWNFDLPAFEMPNRHGSMKDHAAVVEVMIRSTRDSNQRHLGRLKQLKDYANPTEAMLDTHELIALKVPVHFTHVAIVLLSMMVSSTKSGDYRIPPLGEPTRFAKYDHVISGRSMGAFFAYQGGRNLLDTLEQYMITEREQHLLDPLLMPGW